VVFSECSQGLPPPPQDPPGDFYEKTQGFFPRGGLSGSKKVFPPQCQRTQEWVSISPPPTLRSGRYHRRSPPRGPPQNSPYTSPPPPPPPPQIFFLSRQHPFNPSFFFPIEQRLPDRRCSLLCGKNFSSYPSSSRFSPLLSSPECSLDPPISSPRHSCPRRKVFPFFAEPPFDALFPKPPLLPLLQDESCSRQRRPQLSVQAEIFSTNDCFRPAFSSPPFFSSVRTLFSCIIQPVPYFAFGSLRQARNLLPWTTACPESQ